MKKIDLVISKNHFVFACSCWVLLHLHRVSTFSSLEKKTNSVEETTNSVERTEVKIKIVVTMAITALLVLGQWCLCIFAAGVCLSKIQDRRQPLGDQAKVKLINCSSTNSQDSKDKFFKKWIKLSSSSLLLLLLSFFASGNVPKLLPCHAHCSTGVMIAKQWYACFVKVDAKKKTEINASLTSSFVASGASGFSLP